MTDKYLDEAKRLLSLSDEELEAEMVALALRMGEQSVTASEQLAEIDRRVLNEFFRGSDDQAGGDVHDEIGGGTIEVPVTPT